MGFMAVIGRCFCCGRTFAFNASYVPSHEGEPVCGDCMGLANEKRLSMGLPPHPIHPDAYEPEEVP